MNAPGLGCDEETLPLTWRPTGRDAGQCLACREAGAGNLALRRLELAGRALGDSAARFDGGLGRGAVSRSARAARRRGLVLILGRPAIG